MKRLFLTLSVIFLAFSAVFSTEQIADRLIIGKDTIYLKSFPLDNLKLKKAPFDYGGHSFLHSGCWRGYVATWQIIDENLTLKEVQKTDSTETQLNIVEFLSDNGYNSKIINGYVVADWYSDTLKLYDFFTYNWAHTLDEFYVSHDYLRDKNKKIELVFENGKLIRNDIVPIENYILGDTLSLDVYYYKNWFAGHKNITVQGIIRENNGKKVRLEIFSLGTDNKSLKRELQKKINLDYLWVNPRYCKKKE